MKRLALRSRLVELTLDRIEKEKRRARRAGARTVGAGAAAGTWFAAAPRQLSEMSADVRDSLREKADDFDADELWDRILEDVRGKADDAREAADAAKDRAREAAGMAKDAALATAGTAKDVARETAGTTKNVALATVRTAKDATRATKDATRKTARRAAHGMRAGARRTKETAEDLFEHLQESDLRDLEIGSRAAALGSWFVAVPQLLAQMPDSVARSLASRRGFPGSAEALWNLVPNGVKTSADAVEAFIERHLSHIESVKNNPERAGDITNVVFECAKWNWRRGGKDMTPLELARVRLDNFAEGVFQATKAGGRAAAKGALVGALMELPVSAAENVILVKGKGRTVREASLAVLKDIGRNAAAGGAGAAVMTGIAVIGVPTGPIVASLAVVGGIVYLWSSTDRIWTAHRIAAGPEPGTVGYLVANTENEASGATGDSSVPPRLLAEATEPA